VEKKPDENNYNCKISINDTQKKKGSAVTPPLYTDAKKLFYRAVRLRNLAPVECPKCEGEGKKNYFMRVSKSL
jgi:hypothetical protein